MGSALGTAECVSVEKRGWRIPARLCLCGGHYGAQAVGRGTARERRTFSFGGPGHRVPRLRLPQHPQNLLFAAPSLPHLQALLSRSREPRQASISQLPSGLVFGFWVSSTHSVLDTTSVTNLWRPRREDATVTMSV